MGNTNKAQTHTRSQRYPRRLFGVGAVDAHFADVLLKRRLSDIGANTNEAKKNDAARTKKKNDALTVGSGPQGLLMLDAETGSYWKNEMSINDKYTNVRPIVVVIGGYRKMVLCKYCAIY